MNNTTDQNDIQPTIALGGWAGMIGAICMLIAVALQAISGWFPDVVLASGDIASWYKDVIASQTVAMIGVVLMLVSLVLYMLFALSLFTLLGRRGNLSTIGLAGYIIGIPVGIVAFGLGLAATWAMVPLYANATPELQPVMEAFAATILRIFLVGDDMATVLIISIGNTFSAVALARAGWIPRWLMWFGVAAGIIFALSLIGYLLPPFAIGIIGAPLSVLWILITGIFLLRSRAKVASFSRAMTQAEAAAL